jgi:hypothetical protein
MMRPITNATIAFDAQPNGTTMGDPDQSQSKVKADPSKKSKVKADPSKTLSVPEAGQKYFGLSRGGSYEAARRGDLPVIKIGGRKRVPVLALERMLEEARPLSRQGDVA